MTFNPDALRYLIICSDKGDLYVAERELSEMDSGNTLKSLASGEWTNVASVIAFNPVERICEDVTREVASAVMNLWANDGEPLTHWQRSFVEQHVSIQAANSFRAVA